MPVLRPPSESVASMWTVQQGEVRAAPPRATVDGMQVAGLVAMRFMEAAYPFMVRSRGRWALDTLTGCAHGTRFGS